MAAITLSRSGGHEEHPVQTAANVAGVKGAAEHGTGSNGSHEADRGSIRCDA